MKGYSGGFSLKRAFVNCDYWILLPFVCLCVFGILMVYSASSSNLAYANVSTTSYFFKQAAFDFLALVMLYVVSAVPQRWYRKKPFIVIVKYAMPGLLLLVLHTAPVNGARAWISLGPISVQPSEICKAVLIVWLANLLENQYRLKMAGKEVHRAWSIIILLLIAILIALEPDLGGLCVNASIVLVMLVTALSRGSLGRKIVKSVAVMVPVLICLALWLLKSGFLVGIMKKMSGSYAIQRFVGFQDPFGHVATSGKQLVNSYIAISNGGLRGMGLGNGIQKRGYLPEPYTDFVLSITAEELGIIGVLIVLVSLMMLIVRIIIIGCKADFMYDRLICYGTAAMLFMQSFLNIGAVCGLVPITGVTLPFVSYGGSSALILASCLGLVMAVSSKQKDRKRRRALERK